MSGRVAGRIRSALRLRSRLRVRQDAWTYRRTFTGELTREVANARRSEVAVVLHLYHLDLWPEIRSYLSRLPPADVDYFVTTTPDRLTSVREMVGADIRARVIPVPNRGRDVLPFVKTAQMLQSAGYTSVLKVHSKKSVHHPDSEGWLGEMLDELLPTDPARRGTVLTTLTDGQTGIIGPEASYYPSSYFLSGNRRLVHDLIRDLEGRHAAATIMNDRLPELGFFAGTMFWARLDAVSDLLEISPLRFPDEGGQSDATMAHAVERLFTFLPQLASRRIYTVGRSGLTEAKLPG